MSFEDIKKIKVKDSGDLKKVEEKEYVTVYHMNVSTNPKDVMIYVEEIGIPKTPDLMAWIRYRKWSDSERVTVDSREKEFEDLINFFKKIGIIEFVEFEQMSLDL